MGFHIQLRVNLVKSRKQISKHQNQGYWKFVRKIKEKNTSAELSGCRTVLVPKCLTQIPNCPGVEVSSILFEVCLIQIKEQVGEKKSTVGAHVYFYRVLTAFNNTID